MRDSVPVRVAHPDPDVTVSFAPLGRMASHWCQCELRFPPEGVVEVLAAFEFAGGRVLWQRLPALTRNHVLAQLRLDGVLQRITLHVSGSGRLAQPELWRFERVGIVSQLAAMARRGLHIFQRDGFGVLWSALNYAWRLTRPGAIVIAQSSATAAGEQPYDTWMRVFDEAPERDRARHAERLAALTRRPPISVLVALDRADVSDLNRLRRGLAEQIYPNWELLLAAPTSLHGKLQTALATLDAARYRLIDAGATPADSLNKLLAEARGEWLLPLGTGRQLRPHALLDLALTLDRHASAEVIYSDEDCLDAAGRRSDPRFKPAWSPELLADHDYFGDLTLLRAATLRSLGGWRAETCPAHRHDLLRRVAAEAAPEAIVHVAKVLVHGTAGPEPPPRAAARQRPALPAPVPRVSLIIPTRDNADLLAACVRSIRARTRYPDYEILIVDNDFVKEDTRKLFAELAADPKVRILPRPGPFNFSRLNNSAAREATGAADAILALVNNDVEVTDHGWLDELVALAVRPEIGCVGARLLYPDGRLQHGGVVVGIGGVAGHVHRFAAASDPGYLDRLGAVQNVSAVTAACMVVRKAVFDQVGGLDESLTVAFNDVDFCLKVRAAGYRNVWTPFASLIHHESVSRGHDFTPAKARRFADECAALQRRWGAALLHDPYYSPNLTHDREDFSIRLR